MAKQEKDYIYFPTDHLHFIFPGSNHKMNTAKSEPLGCMSYAGCRPMIVVGEFGDYLKQFESVKDQTLG